MAKQQVRVRIFNQTYSLLSEGDPAEVEEIARRIDELMISIADHTASGDSTRIAVLACLHLADKLREAEKQLREYQDESERISTLLEEALEGAEVQRAQ